MRCPVCKAQVNDGTQCGRCRADLSLLVSVEEERERALYLAHCYAVQGLWHHVVAASSQANALRQGEDSLRLMAVGHLAQRDFPRAWQAYRALNEAPRPE